MKIARMLTLLPPLMWIPTTPITTFVAQGLLTAQKRFQEAIAECNAALTIDSTLGGAYLLRGDVYIRIGRTTDALSDFNEACRHNCQSSQLFYLIGRTQAKESRFDKAIESFNNAIAIDPTDPLFYESRALCWNDSNNIDRGLADLSVAVRLDPQNTSYRLLRCRQLKYSCDLVNANSDAAAALESTPSSQESLYFFAARHYRSYRTRWSRSLGQ